jgi:hypothetical protein
MLTLSGQVLSGFVERVGDPVPLVTADGSSHPADELLVDALDGMVELAGEATSSQIAIAVPAHWTGATLRALRAAMRAKPRLAPNGVPARLVSDAVAALTAMHADPGLPGRGVVALMDFGGGGTSITLADAASSFEPIATSRVTEFSGDQIDQALLAHVLDGIADADGVDPAGTAAVGSLTALRDECRRAKELLSEQTDAEVSVELPGHRSTVRVTRAELDGLMEAPLAAVLAELDDLLLRNRVAAADVSTVAAVGGGARMPLIAQRLSAHGEAPVLITPQPALDAAAGAVLFAAYGSESDAATGMAPAALIGVAPIESIAPTTPVVTGNAPGSSTFRQLAWSQDDDASAEPVPYMGEDYSTDTSMTRAVAQYVPPTGPIDVKEPRAWQRLPQLVFGVAAVVALVAFGGVAIALTSATGDSTPSPTPTPKTVPATATPLSSSVAPPPPPPSTEVPQSIVTVTSEAPPPPPPETVTVERTVTTTRTTEPTTTTTTTTTTSPTTTTTTTTTPTTTTTTTPTMTTSYITVPFVPVPIPIQVPATPTPQYQLPPQYQPVPQYPQQPQFPF